MLSKIIVSRDDQINKELAFETSLGGLFNLRLTDRVFVNEEGNITKLCLAAPRFSFCDWKGFTDAQIIKITNRFKAELSEMTDLELTDTPVSLKEYAFLDNFPKLARVYIPGTDVTLRTIENIKKKHPHIEIVITYKDRDAYLAE